jgi:hypothetical protein
MSNQGYATSDLYAVEGKFDFINTTYESLEESEKPRFKYLVERFNKLFKRDYNLLLKLIPTLSEKRRVNKLIKYADELCFYIRIFFGVVN